MKNIKFLLFIFALSVVMVSCVTTERAGGEYYDRDARTTQTGDRLYIQDPYYGTVILERDPFTGRYYDVTYGYRGYGSFYNNPYQRRYNNYYRNYRENNRNEQQRPSREEIQKNREDARKKVLGNN